MDLTDDAGASLAERARWLQWTALSEEHLAKMHQPPYGDRAIILKATGELVGSVGFVPCLMPFEQLPYFGAHRSPAGPARSTPEFGLFWAISPAHQRQGYATEAARAMVDYAFRHLNLKRVIATTEYDQSRVDRRHAQARHDHRAQPAARTAVVAGGRRAGNDSGYLKEQ